MPNAFISAIAHYVPDKVVTNSFFESYLETSDEWIVTRTGIKERRHLEEGGTSQLAIPAVKRLLEQRGIGAEELDLIIVATVTPDMLFPSTACLIQRAVGAKNAWGYDLEGACSGFLFALTTGVQFIRSGFHKKVLVVGADKMSSITNFQDRNIAVLFGDAGSAVLLEPTDDPELGIIDIVNYCDGSGADSLYMRGGGSLQPASVEGIERGDHFIWQDGKAVFKVAVVGMADVSEQIMKRNNLSPDDVAYLIPHQANLRIIQATADRMGLSMDKVIVNIDRFGNTTAATIPSCISEYYQAGKIKKGDNLVLAAFGAGYTWGGALVRWAI